MICIDCQKEKPNHSEGRCNTCYKRAKFSADIYLCTQCTTLCKKKPSNINMLCTKCYKKESDRFKYESDPKSAHAYTAQWKSLNKTKAASYAHKHYVSNKSKYREKDAFRRAREIKATPKWVDRSELKKIYAECPKGFHVDHIVPLNHPLVCGLHVPANLQVIPAAENLRKNNKFNGNE